MTPEIKALTFDVGGTVLDWHRGLSRAFADAGVRRGINADWPAIANEYRRRSLQAMVGQTSPSFNIDDVHRHMLDAVIQAHDLSKFTLDDREIIRRTWHELDAWPDFPAALARLRRKYAVVAFTILSTSLIVDVSRRNGLTWDAVVSCDMIGVYKTRPPAYDTCARWLGHRPAELLMVACHNFDLLAARGAGYRSAFVKRPARMGSRRAAGPAPGLRPRHRRVGFRRAGPAARHLARKIHER
jgi:2-haloacid dehalogenase